MAKFIVDGPGSDDYFVEPGDVIVAFPDDPGIDRIFTFDDYTMPQNIEQMYVVGSGLTGIGNSQGQFLISAGGPNTLVGLGGDDNYAVGNSADVVVEAAGGGYDQIFAVNTDYQKPANVEVLHMWNTEGVMHTATGTDGNDVFVNSFGANAFELGRGHDVMVFTAGSADGSVVRGFNGTGNADSDFLLFTGYGPGATFEQEPDKIHWTISDDVGHSDTIIVMNQAGGHANIHDADFLFL